MKALAKAADPPVEHADYQRRVAFLLGAVSNLIAAGGSRLYRQAFDLGIGEGRLLYVLGYESDLTAARDELKARHRDVEFHLAPPLGPHPLLDELVTTRIRELDENVHG